MTEFTYRNYFALLKYIRESGIKIVNFNNVCSDDPAYVILRHDIDFSLEKALEMARMEHSEGVNSTYFVLLTAAYYNPLSWEGVGYIKEIASLGHECGLHYDCTGFELLSDEQIRQRISCLAATLEDATGVPIKTIAQHKPAKSPIRKEFPAFRNAYSPEFFKDIPYISDSRKMFRHPDLYEFFRNNRKSQLLIHPIWWNKENLDVAAIFSNLRKDINKDIGYKISLEKDAIDAFFAKQS